MLAGRPRPRSSRLREAIERLLVGSADQILADLAARAIKADGAEPENILRKAQRAGDCAYAAFDWAHAQRFYELALEFSQPWQREELQCRLAECR